MRIHTRRNGKGCKDKVFDDCFNPSCNKPEQGGRGKWPELTDNSKEQCLQSFFAGILLWGGQIIFVMLVVGIETMENKRMTWGELHKVGWLSIDVLVSRHVEIDENKGVVGTLEMKRACPRKFWTVSHKMPVHSTIGLLQGHRTGRGSRSGCRAETNNFSKEKKHEVNRLSCSQPFGHNTIFFWYRSTTLSACRQELTRLVAYVMTCASIRLIILISVTLLWQYTYYYGHLNVFLNSMCQFQFCK